MPTPSRRRVLTGSAVSLAALAGCVATAVESTEPETGSDADLPDDLEAVLGAIPDEDDVDGSYEGVILAAVGDDAEDLDPESRRLLEELEAVDRSRISQVGTVIFENYRPRIGIAAGSFDRPEPGSSVDDDGEWRLAEDRESAYATADGRAAIVGGEDATDLAGALVEAATGEATGLFDEREYLATAVSRLASFPHVYVITDPDDALSTSESDRLRAFVAAADQPPGRIEGVADNEFVLYPSADGALSDDEIVEGFVRELGHGTVLETEIHREERAVRVEAVVEQPLERDIDAAPNARFRADVEGGGVELEHEDGETIDGDDLELWVDGELASSQPAESVDEVAVGDVLAVETKALATVTLRWVDEDEYVYHDYVTVVVGEGAFETASDVDDGRIELTYTGEREANPDRLAFEHRRADGETVTPAVDGADGTLASGDSLVVSDVELDDTVSVELDVPPEPSGRPARLVRVRARPPQVHTFRDDDAVVVAYADDEARDAAEFRVRVDDEPVADQPADRTDVLDTGDELAFELPALGEELVVEWTAPDDPVDVASYANTPRIATAFEYDDGDGTLTVVHDDGDAVPAGQLELLVDGEPADRQPADEYETFEPDDSLSLAVEPFAPVEHRWAAGEHDRPLGRTITGEESIDASYDPNERAARFVYTGGRDADAGRLGVYRDGIRGNEEPEPLFADEGTLTEGDAATVSDVEPYDRLAIVLVDDEPRASRALLRFDPTPRRAFALEDRDGEVVAVYRDRVERDAAAFRVRADGEETNAQPDDALETLSAGNEIELGSFSPGTELVVEWTAPADPIEVDDHVVVPSPEFETSADDGEVTIEHVGGDEVAATDVDVMIHPSHGDLVGWDGEGTISSGETASYAVDESPEIVSVVYRERELLAETRLDD
ncbi:hypothetical protein [Natrarchaeobius oligotrophus]|uniref:Uncharacterized protein n=1 Tax=Natrarchaeobius chitinivorans TaxID=1679083 RepID=A0A3N6MAQ9_NATCH|nr:hypothetical protein [Natrarchaeobius chitinivorans]RQH00859.1 hypothetical protein EA472_09540 [Natrarchaeobius chitinivorans]